MLRALKLKNDHVTCACISLRNATTAVGTGAGTRYVDEDLNRCFPATSIYSDKDPSVHRSCTLVRAFISGDHLSIRGGCMLLSMRDENCRSRMHAYLRASILVEKGPAAHTSVVPDTFAASVEERRAREVEAKRPGLT